MYESLDMLMGTRCSTIQSFGRKASPLVNVVTTLYSFYQTDISNAGKYINQHVRLTTGLIQVISTCNIFKTKQLILLSAEPRMHTKGSLIEIFVVIANKIHCFQAIKLCNRFRPTIPWLVQGDRGVVQYVLSIPGYLATILLLVLVAVDIFVVLFQIFLHAPNLSSLQ